MIKGYRSRFDAFTKVGLQKRSEVLAAINKDNRLRLEALLKQAEKDGQDEYIWDSDFVYKWSNKMDKLNQELNETEDQTRTINRRQEALNLEISEFPELQRLRNDIKPLS